MPTKAELEAKIVELEAQAAEALAKAEEKALLLGPEPDEGVVKDLEHKLFEANAKIDEQEKMIEAARSVEDSLNAMLADAGKAADNRLHAMLVDGLGEHYEVYLERAYAPADELGLARGTLELGDVVKGVLSFALGDLRGFKGEIPLADRLAAIVGIEKVAAAADQADDEASSREGGVDFYSLTQTERDDLVLHVLLAPERETSASVTEAMGDTEKGQMLAKLSRLEIERNDARHKGQLIANELAQVRAANAGTMHGSIDTLSTG